MVAQKMEEKNTKVIQDYSSGFLKLFIVRVITGN